MKSAEVVGHCTDKSLDGCCDTEQLSEQSKRDESIDNQQCKKVNEFPSYLIYSYKIAHINEFQIITCS